METLVTCIQPYLCRQLSPVHATLWCPALLMHKYFSFLSWNVRGLGQVDKCDDVLSELINVAPSIIGMQETKLAAPSAAKTWSFLPSRLFPCGPGCRRCLWRHCSCLGCLLLHLVRLTAHPHSVSATLKVLADGNTFKCTNVYAPSVHSKKQAFLNKISQLAPHDNHP